MQKLEAIVEERTGAWVLVLRGSATAANSDALVSKATRLSASRPSNVVVDMTGLEFISSLPIGELVSLARAVKLHGGKVLIAGPNPAVREVMNHVRLGEVMPMFETVEAAIAA